MNLFFDTSALVKIFQREVGSDAVIELIKQDNVNLFISELAKLELISALHRRLRMNQLDEKQLAEVCGILDEELSNFKIEPLSSGVLIEAERLIKFYSKKVGLRTLDALHLATFRLLSEHNCKFVVADKVLLAIAAEMDIEFYNPTHK